MSKGEQAPQPAVHTVDEHDYKLLQEAKKRNEELSKVQAKYNQDFSKKHVQMMILQLERQQKFQEDQLKNKKIIEKDERFEDGKKQPFQIENDLEKTKFDLWNYREQLRQMDGMD